MTYPILTVLALFVLQTILAPTVRYLLAGPGVGARVWSALGPRDDEPPLSALGHRADRALRNLQEALPVFLTLALLHEVHGTGAGLATSGAWAFLAARILYVPAYLSGVRGLRSTVWSASWLGLGAMIAALVR